MKASKALLAHIAKAAKEKSANSTKKSLLDDAEEDQSQIIAQTPVWLALTTKRHILDSNRLQPGKIILPHPLNTDPETTICIITADPQRAYKNIVASEEFPAELRKRITRVIDLTHLKAKFKQYEAQRKLFAEHDIFLGDDRIINRLPKALGKTFYKNTTKRPIPVVLQKPREKVEGKRVKREKSKEDVNARPAAQVAAEIERAIGAALVHLSPSTNTSVKVGYAGMKPAELSANIQTVTTELVKKFVPKKQENLRSIFIKGPETVALPIWQTDELWLDAEKDVLADGSEKAKAIEARKEKPNIGKKRKSLDAADDEEEAQKEEPQPKKRKGDKLEKGEKKDKKEKASKKEKLPESNDDKLDQEIAERKAKLKKQKKAAKAALDD